MRLENIQKKMIKINQKKLKAGKLTQKYPKSVKVTAKFLLRTKSTGLALKILLLVPKPTGQLMPSCRNNFYLWPIQTDRGQMTKWAKDI